MKHKIQVAKRVERFFWKVKNPNTMCRELLARIASVKVESQTRSRRWHVLHLIKAFGSYPLSCAVPYYAPPCEVKERLKPIRAYVARRIEPVQRKEIGAIGAIRG